MGIPQGFLNIRDMNIGRSLEHREANLWEPLTTLPCLIYLFQERDEDQDHIIFSSVHNALNCLAASNLG